MWRTFVIMIEIIILIIVLRTSFVQYFLSDIQQTVLGWIENVAEIPEQQSLATIRERFFHNNMSLQPHQTDYVVLITDSKESLTKFNERYCINNDKNPFIYGANLNRLCGHIKDSKLF
ncbi:hypothetical protein [Alteromonas sp. W364]|jgi:hypothetical protein|uniref:hypothetical protein n=1 Tax=Alteromonas sp. W364 TaxID=3075610 RepID=UPI00288808A4|nr:hypothetical protein [Alteromonas sp. W364]MDT0627416.1 hypothetical protein [Alteromonas sp. W364]